MIYGLNLVKGTIVSGSLVYGSIRPAVKPRFATIGIVLWTLTLLLNGCREKENLPSQKEVISFEIKTISGKASIDNVNGLINMVVPFGTLLRDLLPDIKISAGASIVPSAAVPQDFTKPVYYTVTGPDGSKRVYKVIIVSAAQAAPEIAVPAKDTIQAGDTLLVKGRNFGTFALAITTFLKDKVSGDETAVPFRLIDSTRVQVILPASLKPSDYYVLIYKEKLKGVSPRTINVRIHDPVITALRKSHLMQGDTVIVAGNYIFPDQYKYTISLLGEKKYTLTPILSQNGKLGAVVPTDVTPGVYNVSIVNTNEHFSSEIFNPPLVVYDGQLPFVREILEPKATYTAENNIRFKTTNFSKINARFYSINLSDARKQYVQNGIFSETKEILSTVLASDIVASEYRIRIYFLDATGNLIYELELDDTIKIN